jgi:tetratricopeptide (TPR) repeat protein
VSTEKPPTRRQIDSERRRLDQRLFAHLDAGELRDAFRLEPEYRELARQARAPELLGYFLFDIGDARYEKEEYPEALRYYLAGLSEMGSDPLEQGVAALQISYCYSFLHRYEEAMRWLNRCLENRSFYANGRAAAFAERARLEVERHQRYPDSIYHYLCALELYDAKKPFYSAEGHQGALFGLALTFDEARLSAQARSGYRKVIQFGHPEFGYVKEAETSLKRLEKIPDPLP